jgi:hypothetical protein
MASFALGFNEGRLWQSSVLGLAAHTAAHMAEMVRAGRWLCFTHDGYIGLVPTKTEEHDKICILKGFAGRLGSRDRNRRAEPVRPVRLPGGSISSGPPRSMSHRLYRSWYRYWRIRNSKERCSREIE